MTENNKNRKPSKYLLGASIAAAVAAGVVAFLTQTKKGKQLAFQGKQHAADIAKLVAARVETMKLFTQERYSVMIDEVLSEYQRRKKITKDAAEELSKTLKNEWNTVKKELKKPPKK
ncbi:MAG TPA: hypothetical protein VJB65_04585 [Patescibacteria group bacterium]|nr:hypothetical protein [Patescibacteria group bacterium]